MARAPSARGAAAHVSGPPALYEIHRSVLEHRCLTGRNSRFSVLSAIVMGVRFDDLPECVHDEHLRTHILYELKFFFFFLVLSVTGSFTVYLLVALRVTQWCYKSNPLSGEMRNFRGTTRRKAYLQKEMKSYQSTQFGSARISSYIRKRFFVHQ